LAPGKNKTVVLLLKVSVTAISLYIVFTKAGIGQILIILRSLNPVYFLLASLVYILAQFVSTIRWKFLLPDKFSIKKLFSLYMIGAFFSSFLPGVIGGDAVKAYYLNKDAKKLSITLASIFMDRYVGYVSLMTIGISAFPFALGYFGESQYKWLMPFIFTAFIVGSFLFFGLQLGRRIRGISDFYDYFNTFRAKKVVLLKAFSLSLVIQFLNFSMIIIIAFALGEDIPLLVLCVFLPIVITVASMPISISGLGVREGAFVILLGIISIKPEISASLSLAWFFSIFIGSIPGLIAYFIYTDKKKTQI
jgi:uncharacterized membrane protein YbhN (UPF0104 family)